MCIGATLPRLRACLLLLIFRVNINPAMKLGPQLGQRVGYCCGATRIDKQDQVCAAHQVGKLRRELMRGQYLNVVAPQLA